MAENPNHVTITLNDAKESSIEQPKQQTRGRSRRRSGSRSRSSSRSRNRRDADSARRDATPLLPEGILPRQKPPTAGPEFDDEDENEGENKNPFDGIDDGFFPEDDRNIPDGRDEKIPESPTINGMVPRRRGSIPPVFPYTPPDYGGPGIVSLPGDSPRVIPDINVYQHKKSLAQGMLDLALLSANANQLRYVLESYQRHPYYYFSLSFIVASLVIQVFVGIGLVLNSRYNIKSHDDICKADRINNFITIGILLITILNVFISAFGVAEIRS